MAIYNVNKDTGDITETAGKYGSSNNVFYGTIAQWNALTTEQKKEYNHASITDSIDGGVTFPANKVVMTGGGNVEDAIGDLTSGLTNLLKYKVFSGTASDTTYHLYDTGVPVSQYVCVGGCTPNNPNYYVETSNIEVSASGYIRYRLYDVVTNQVVSDNAAYLVYLVFVDTAMLSELVITP